MAAVKVSAATSRIRDLLGDQFTPYRHTPVNLYRYITDAERLIVSEHPEAQYITEVANSAITDKTSETQDLQVDSNYLNTLVEYVVSKVSIEDAEDSANLTLSNNHAIRAGEEMM